MSRSASVALLGVLFCLAGVRFATAAGSAATLGDHLAPDAPRAAAPAPALQADNQGVELVVNQLRMLITNFGNFGNNFQNRNPSLEYPPGVGFEHLTHAGLWVGARSSDSLGAYIGVTTGGYDQTLGIAAYLCSEFSPVTSIWPRSDLPASPFFDPNAVSDIDLLTDYDDSIVKVVSGNWEDSRPLGLIVHQETYAWQTASLQAMVFTRFVVRTTRPMTDVWLGLFTEFASVPKNAYVDWPPSSSDPGGMGAWYGKKWVVYEDSLRLIREHYCAAQPVPGGCQLAVMPVWIGAKILSAPAVGQQIRVAAWPWGPTALWHRYDTQRYDLMRFGTDPDFTADSLAPGTGDPVELISLGPFASLVPGDSLELDFAFLGAPDESTLRERARLAQRVHDVGYRNALTPTLASLAEQVLEPGRVRLVWMLSRVEPGTRVERAGGAAWSDLGEATREGLDRLAFEDRGVTPGASYDYRLRLASGETLGEVTVRVPDAPAFGIAIAGPRPARSGAVRVRLALEPGPDARVDVFDVTGRRVLARPVAAGGGGTRELALEVGGALAPGVYLARLSQGARSAIARFVVLE